MEGLRLHRRKGREPRQGRSQSSAAIEAATIALRVEARGQMTQLAQFWVDGLAQSDIIGLEADVRPVS